MKTIAFFNNKGGVGKTSMVYHLAWMLRRLGYNVVAVDLDPQSNLSSMFLVEDVIESLWDDGARPRTILGCVEPLIDKIGDLFDIEPYRLDTQLWLLPGDLGLSRFEDRLSVAWRECLDDNPSTLNDAFRVMSAFHRCIATACEKVGAQLALIDVGPNIGAMNRAALVSADYVVIPLGADLFSLQGLRNLGPTLRDWRSGWHLRRDRAPKSLNLPLPSGDMTPLGYVLLNPSVRENRPVKAYQRWANRVPSTYRDAVLQSNDASAGLEPDANQLAMLKHFKSLMPMAQDARKPMFELTAADGAIGGHGAAVRDCFRQFEGLAGAILERADIALP